MQERVHKRRRVIIDDDSGRSDDDEWAAVSKKDGSSSVGNEVHADTGLCSGFAGREHMYTHKCTYKIGCAHGIKREKMLKCED